MRSRTTSGVDRVARPTPEVVLDRMGALAEETI